MKNKSGLYLKKTFAICILTVSFSATSQAATDNYCIKMSKSYSQNLSKNFKQNPIEFLEQFLQASRQEISNTANQNKLISASFDLRKVYRANAKTFKSKIITNSLFDWVRTQYFGNLEKNYLNKNKYFLKKNQDMLTESERLNMKNFKPQWTAIEKINCTKKETARLGCRKNLFKVTLQLLPEFSCKKRTLKKAFKTNFYLTYHSKYGFKILDMTLSGKRILMDSIDMMISLREEGFNKNAISKHLNLLAQGKRTFKIPRRQVHSGRFLANFGKSAEQDRAPASL